MSYARISVENLLKMMLAMNIGDTIDIGEDWGYGYEEELCNWHVIYRIDMNSIANDPAPTFILDCYGGTASSKLFAHNTEFSFKENVESLSRFLKDEDSLYDYGYVYIDNSNTKCVE